MASTQLDDQRSLGELFSDAMRDVGQLLRQEVELAKTETREEVQRAARAGSMFAVAGVLGFLALFLLAFAVAWALAEVMPAGVAFLIVALVAGGIAFAVLQVARERVKHVDPVPRETVDTIKEDVQWVKARGN
jgi:cobalamin biosynthesis protein CobD/CbiB